VPSKKDSRRTDGHKEEVFKPACVSETEDISEDNMYAVIETGGKQYRVSEGDVVYIEKLDVNADEEVVFDRVLYVAGDEGESKAGDPLVAGATVTAKVIKNGKSKKIVVFTYRPKKGSKRKLGHRQQFTKIEITTINA